MDIISIKDLEDLKNESPSYVIEQLATRIEDISNLPTEVYNILNETRGTILDVGPGEGISSMALAHEFVESSIVGLEMDKKHLVGAWPECNKYNNLELFFGALPGTPSNKKVDNDIVIPQIKSKPVNTLFTWTGMSRKDIFVNNEKWRHVVKDTCVFIVPKFWREGASTLKDWEQIESLLTNISGEIDLWPASDSIPGFSKYEVYPLTSSLAARGWILWLSGIFDTVDVSFWNTLTDRWREKIYQLTDVELPLEIIVAYK